MNDGEETEGEPGGQYVRARVGAMLLAEGLHELKLIRKALTTPAKE